MFKVLLRAPLLTNSGYGVHSRQIFEWLFNRKDVDLRVECLKWGETPWIVNPDAEKGLFGKIMSCSSGPRPDNDISFQVQLPDEWDASLAKYNVGVTALVESTRCNPDWLKKMNEMDSIIVPSNFTKKVIEKNFRDFLKKDVTVIPEWFNTHLNQDKKRFSDIYDDRYEFDTKFNLLTIGTLTSLDADSDRKNLINTIKWAIQTFEGDPDVGIVVKTCLGRGSVEDREMSKSAIHQIVTSFRKSDFPKIHLIHGNMTSREIAGLFRSRKIHGYITGTRGEGYGLPLVEAAASGIPVVATNWSGHLDFLGDNFLKVDYELRPIPSSRVDGRIFIDGAMWAEPFEEHFVSQLIDLKENHSKHLSSSSSLKKSVKNNFSKSKICKKYDKFFEQVSKR